MFSRNCLHSWSKVTPEILNLAYWTKTTRTLVLTKTNQHVKYKSFVINSSQDNEQKPCLHYFTNVTVVTLPFDLVNPKSIGVLSSLRPIRTLHMKAKAVINSSQENERTLFCYKSDLCDHDLWSKAHKINRG